MLGLLVPPLSNDTTYITASQQTFNLYHNMKNLSYLYNVIFIAVLLPETNMGSSAAPQTTLGITALFKFWPKVDQKPCNKVGMPQHGRAPSGVWTGNLPILLQRINPLRHASWIVVIKLQFLSLFTLTSVYYIFQNCNTFKIIFTFPFIKHTEVSYFFYSVDTVKRCGYNF